MLFFIAAAGCGEDSDLDYQPHYGFDTIVAGVEASGDGVGYWQAINADAQIMIDVYDDPTVTCEDAIEVRRTGLPPDLATEGDTGVYMYLSLSHVDEEGEMSAQLVGEFRFYTSTPVSPTYNEASGFLRTFSHEWDEQAWVDIVGGGLGVNEDAELTIEATLEDGADLLGEILLEPCQLNPGY